MNGRRIAIMQPYFFPYIGYWQMLAMADVFVVYDDGLFRKEGWINRNRILGTDGVSPQLITLPVHDKSCNRRINETKIGRDARYPKLISKLIRSLEMRYGKAPYFRPAMDVLRPLIECEEEGLSDYLTAGLRGVMDYLGLETRLMLSSEVDKSGLTGVVDKVERICKTVGITDYVNACGGEELYDRDDFRSRGLSLSFIRRNADIAYRQFGNGFVPDLSIIDVMMFNSPAEIAGLLTRYSLF